MLEVLKKMYEAEIEKARANISIFLENPAGIGDHSDIIGAMDEQVVKLCDASGKLESLEKHFEKIEI
jgi:hypothetical protein|tara:strand:- start:71361 stop:71561 length:201 start_codon:yes stop_codon:yes gene_type:complete